MAEQKADAPSTLETTEEGLEDHQKRPRVETGTEESSSAQSQPGSEASLHASMDQQSFAPDAFQVGDLVFVTTHKQGKKEIEEGKVKIISRKWNADHGNVLYDISYVLFKRVVKDVSSKFLRRENIAFHDKEICEALAVQDVQPTSCSDDKWVRRSRRYAGNDQLGRPHVQELLGRLEKDDPNDSSLVVLRLKNWLEADTNAQVLTRVFELVAKSKVVQALYVQNMEQGMDDLRLQLLTKALIQNQRIWALNVGENFKITKKGWEQFAKDLCKTGVTHIYAGSESTVSGELKVRMRDAVRDNRSKHNLHMSRDNLSVIMQIGQMWWNPRNSKVVQSYRSDAFQVCDYKPGDRVVLKDPLDPSTWLYGRITGLADQNQFTVAIIDSNGEAAERVYDLLDPRLAVCNKSEPVLAEFNGRQWPSLHFAEPHVVAFVIAKNGGGRLGFTVQNIQGSLSPFYLDEDDLKRDRSVPWRDSMRATHELVYGK